MEDGGFADAGGEGREVGSAGGGEGGRGGGDFVAETVEVLLCGGDGAGGEEFVKEKRGGENGWSRVVEKSVAAEDAGASAMVWLAFEQGDFVTEGAEAERGGESAEAGADDEGAVVHFSMEN